MYFINIIKLPYASFFARNYEFYIYISIFNPYLLAHYINYLNDTIWGLPTSTGEDTNRLRSVNFTRPS